MEFVLIQTHGKGYVSSPTLGRDLWSLSPQLGKEKISKYSLGDKF